MPPAFTNDTKDYFLFLRITILQIKWALGKIKRDIGKIKRGFVKSKRDFVKSKRDFVKSKRDFVKTKRGIVKSKRGIVSPISMRDDIECRFDFWQTLLYKEEAREQCLVLLLFVENTLFLKTK